MAKMCFLSLDYITILNESELDDFILLEEGELDE